MLLNEYVDFVRGKLSKVGFHQIENQPSTHHAVSSGCAS